MSLWSFPSPLLLASASTARRAMLTDAGIPVDIEPARINERAVDQSLRAAGAPPGKIALALARAKAAAVSAHHPGRLVLGADQLLDCDGTIFDKARDRSEAEQKLAALAGKTHRLTSAAALVRDGHTVFESVSEAYLTMRPLDSVAIALYADEAGAALTASAGCYEIEGRGAHLFSRVEGDHFTIRGLPLLDVLAGFRAEGWIRL